MQDTPYGYCRCGCGERTPLAKYTKGELVKGEPTHWLKGHYQRRPPETCEERFWSKVDKDGPNGCWLWKAGLNSYGYGWFIYVRQKFLSHRYAYELLVGPIPEGLQIDHLCRVRHCVNPAHMEPVTRVENVMRGESPAAQNARKTTCIRGHELTPDPNGKRRRCLVCFGADYYREWARQRAKRPK